MARALVGSPPILVFDKAGKLLRSFGAGMFNFPHGGTVDRDGNLWMTDALTYPDVPKAWKDEGLAIRAASAET